MKCILKFLLIVFLSAGFLSHTNSCRKEEAIPVVTTSEITGIKTNSAICGGTVTDEGSGPVTVRGVCWSLNETFSDTKRTFDGSGDGSFTSDLIGLKDNTSYFVRAYATNDAGTGFGMSRVFRTKVLGQPPSATTLPATQITPFSATLNGSVNPNNSTTTAKIAYSTDSNHYDNWTKDGWFFASYKNCDPWPLLPGNTPVDVSVNVSGLEEETTYYFWLDATNELGRAFGDCLSFKTGKE